jgi:iron complex transport system substrate-binding protein
MFLCSGAAASPPQRIVSLTPSTTELLFALGLDAGVVGVTTACLYPAAARAKYKVGSMVTPSLEAIVARRPDLVVASSDSVSMQLIERLNSLGLKTHVMSGLNVAGFPGALRAFGAVVGRPKQAENIARRIERETAEIKKRYARNRGGRSVLYLIWPDPPMAAGAATPINEALELFGFRNAGLCGPGYYPACSLEAIMNSDPDMIIIGTAHADIVEQNSRLFDRLRLLRAVREGRVYYMTDNLYRLGPRFVDGLRELKEILDKL